VFVISSARVAFAAAIMEARMADGDRPDSSTAKSASYHCTPMRVAACSDSSLQDIWHWPQGSSADSRTPRHQLDWLTRALLHPSSGIATFDAFDLGTLTPTGPAGAFEHRLPFSSQ